MVYLITGPTHVGKTVFAQKLLEKYKIPYLSIDHLKMGLIRSNNTSLTPYDDDKLIDYLWPIIKEIVKTVIENKQNIIIEGCYIHANFRKSFSEEYLKQVCFICLAFDEEYIRNNYREIVRHSCDIESRIDEELTLDDLIEDNKKYINSFDKEKVFVIHKDYEEEIKKLINSI